MRCGDKSITWSETHGTNHGIDGSRGIDHECVVAIHTVDKSGGGIVSREKQFIQSAIKHLNWATFDSFRPRLLQIQDASRNSAEGAKIQKGNVRVKMPEI
jgi:hypothetical protein